MSSITRLTLTAKQLQESSTDVSMPFAVEGVFNTFELKRMKELLKLTNVTEGVALTSGDAQFGNRGEDSARLAYETSIPMTNDFDWFYNKLDEVVYHTNKSTYGFNLIGMLEPSIFLRYESNEKGKYDFHMDLGGDRPVCFRKLSCTILVNDDYEGGDLVFRGLPQDDGQGNKIIHYPKTPGTIIFFPSFMYHAVTPVTKGTRYSIVTWIHGPTFC